MTARPPQRVLPIAFYERPPVEVAPELLNKVLVCGLRSGRIVEVEAYAGTEDPASHAYRGPTPRTQVMFGRPGHLYVYRSYGIHWCANLVAHPGVGAGAVLIRALEPIEGIDAMRHDRRAARRLVDVANGPGKLCQALAITSAHDGLDACAATSVVRVVDDDVAPPPVPVTGPRVGITRAVERPWRFSVPASPFRSKPW